MFYVKSFQQNFMDMLRYGTIV
ncbi:hypothetical protein NC651_001929 [Populus alba x Populus x berolinensis]|nr:hypothetical protein NC651_001929 [Populus alba x Populus x berolinensis]